MTSRSSCSGRRTLEGFGLWEAIVMVFDHGMTVVVDQHASDPQQAVATWQAIGPIADALGGTGGDVLGGVWFLLVSWVAVRSGCSNAP